MIADGLHKLEGAHHVAQIRQGHRGLDHHGHLGRCLQDAELTVGVNMKKVRRHIRGHRNGRRRTQSGGGLRRRNWRRRNRWGSCRGLVNGRWSSRRNARWATRSHWPRLQASAFRFEVEVLQANGRDGTGMLRLERCEGCAIPAELFRGPVAHSDQFQETARRRLHVRRGIVRLGKLLLKQMRMKLAQLGDLKAAALAADDLGDLGRSLGTGIENGQFQAGRIPRGPDVFRPHHLQVKAQIVPDHMRGARQGGFKSVENL